MSNGQTEDQFACICQAFLADMTPPTLREAFVTLCDALQPLVEDNQPLWHVLADALRQYDAGNNTVAWRQVLLALEGVIGMPIRGET